MSGPSRKPSRQGGLDEATERALDRATAGYEPRFLVDLTRFGGLPGPSPNHALAARLAERVVATGRKDLDDVLAARGERTGPGVGPETFFTVTLAFVHAERIRRKLEVDASFERLDELAGDVRAPVRDAVALALAGVASEELAGRLALFTTGFLQGSVALSILADRRALELVADDASLASRVDECFSLVEGASRADERSQGRRRLLEALTETLPTLARRPRVLDLCAARAAKCHPDVRECLERALDGMRRRGSSKVELGRLSAALDASAPPRRDPTTYVGPTRRRGGRAEGRKERR